MTRIPHWIRIGLALWVATALRLSAGTVDLVAPGALWRWLPGTNEASRPDITAWRVPGFDDSGWRAPGPLPIFYGEPLTGTLVEGMQTAYTTLFLRSTFQVSDPGAYSQMVLRAECDDGFIAWINGRQVARYNVPNVPDGDLSFNSVALGAVAEPIAFGDFPAGLPGAVLQKGVNVLAVQVFNASLGSSDIVFDASLRADIDVDPPAVVQVYPQGGSVLAALSSFEVQFSEPVNGVDAADLLVNGVPATAVSEPAAGQFVFSFPAQPVGDVTLAFRTGHGITDRSPGALPFAGGSWTLRVDPASVPPVLVINEFMADNARGIRDEDGRRSDWIEILNTSAQAVSLDGWTLTDDPGRPAKWAFPRLSVPARGYVLVWASGNDRTNAAAPLHANFRLAAEGGYLALVSPAGKATSEFAPAYPPQRADVSYGLVQGGTSSVYFTTPTPGAKNAVGGPGFAPDVEFTPASRAYVTSLDVALSFPTNAPVPPGAVIRYTTDHTLPTEASPLYTGVIRLTNSAVQVRARAFSPGLIPGTPRSEMYFPMGVSAAGFRSDIPVMVIHDFNKGRPPANTRIPSYFQVFEPGPDGLTSFTNPPSLAARAGISVRGSSTEGLSKASLRVEFHDEFDNPSDVSPLGLPKHNDWVLYGCNFFEPVLIHNPFMHQLSRDIGRYSPRTRMCEVYLVTSGTNAISQTSYNGVYVLEERIQVGKDRVDIGGLEPQNLTAPSVTGGYLMKIDRLNPGDSGIFAGNAVIAMVDPSEAEIRDPARAPQLNYLTDYMNRFASALYGADFRDPVKGYRPFIDTGSWIDHHLLNVIAFNVDALRLSAYFGKRREGALEFGPLWDFDRALGSTDGRDANPRVWRSQVSDLGTDFFNFYPWWDRLFRDPDFWQQYIDRYQGLRRAQLSTTNLWRMIDGMGEEVRRAAVRDWAKWGASPRTSTYQGELNLMRSWISNRVAFMDGQFVAPPSIPAGPVRVQPGATATLTVPNGLPVYYTVDGSDPRLPGGGLSPKAQLYAGPIPVNANSRIVARTRNPNHTALTGANNPPLVSIWSGPVASTFYVTPPAVACTEVHFRPKDGPGGAATDFEFVELKNTGPVALDLGGYTLRGGISFDFPVTNPPVRLEPGARLVVVADRAAFTNRYPGVTNIGGVFTGRLANEGDRIALYGPLQEPAFDFAYQPAWLPADAAGFSLVTTDETGASDPSVASSWRVSAAEGGSPGRMDAASLPRPPVPVASAGTDGRVTLRVAVPAGRSLELHAATGVGPLATWYFVQAFGASGADRVETVVLDPGAAAQFYRLANRVP